MAIIALSNSAQDLVAHPFNPEIAYKHSLQGLIFSLIPALNRREKCEKTFRITCFTIKRDSEQMLNSLKSVVEQLQERCCQKKDSAPVTFHQQLLSNSADLTNQLNQWYCDHAPLLEEFHTVYALFEKVNGILRAVLPPSTPCIQHEQIEWAQRAIDFVHLSKFEKKIHCSLDLTVFIALFEERTLTYFEEESLKKILNGMSKASHYLDRDHRLTLKELIGALKTLIFLCKKKDNPLLLYRCLARLESGMKICNIDSRLFTEAWQSYQKWLCQLSKEKCSLPSAKPKDLDEFRVFEHQQDTVMRVSNNNHIALAIELHRAPQTWVHHPPRAQLISWNPEGIAIFERLSFFLSTPGWKEDDRRLQALCSLIQKIIIDRVILQPLASNIFGFSGSFELKTTKILDHTPLEFHALWEWVIEICHGEYETFKKILKKSTLETLPAVTAYRQSLHQMLEETRSDLSEIFADQTTACRLHNMPPCDQGKVIEIALKQMSNLKYILNELQRILLNELHAPKDAIKEAEHFLQDALKGDGVIFFTTKKDFEALLNQWLEGKAFEATSLFAEEILGAIDQATKKDFNSFSQALKKRNIHNQRQITHLFSQESSRDPVTLQY